ncbi:HNH/endonuclease VII fold putative polymorphic toxin [Pseudomonas asplenii]|uniref:HNH/endonuclease VII fold putative polymorphic toxin n=1 Tax=Pseudomonas asplenii TaxID=53407 RepID=UPI0037CC0CB3
MSINGVILSRGKYMSSRFQHQVGGLKTVRIRDDAGGHDFGSGNPQNRGSHFNDEAGNHYDY